MNTKHATAKATRTTRTAPQPDAASPRSTPPARPVRLVRAATGGEPVRYSANVLGKPRLTAARKKSMVRAMLAAA
ncbi:MAG: hypothetical protein ACK54X_19130 [Burkholderiales bacterium]|jgi:hypothetical protein